jgi:TonB-linked SusC/RagA family outer membrane protein
MITKLRLKKTNTNKLLSLLLLCLFVLNANALTNNAGLQQQISGTVIDEEGIPLAGTNVIIQGTTKGTQTDFDGNYTISANKGDVLEFSYLGMLTQSITVGDNTTINITMQEDAAQLAEVVVVGYGVQERRTLAGAIETIDASAFEARPVSNAVQALQGTVPGLIITRSSSQPGNAGLGIQLRGISSLSEGANSPLILVDGIESDFSTLNPDDIESLSVIKDGAAAIYGNRAANGVVLITTKKGQKNSTPQVSYNYNYGFTSPSYTLEKFTTRQYMEVVNEGFVNDGAAPLYPQIFFDAIGTDQVLNFNQTRLGGAEREDSYLVFNQSENAFVDEIFETGTIQTHNLSISGGGENSTYRFSLGYLDEDGVLNAEFDDFNRYNIRLNNTFDLTDKLSLSLQNAVEIGDRSASTQLGAALYRVTTNWTLFPIRRPDGELYTFRGQLNALDLLKQGGEARTKNTRLISNARLDYDIIEGLKATGSIGVNHNTISVRNEFPTIRLINEWTIDDTPGARILSNPNRLVEVRGTESYFNLNGYLTYNKVFADIHDVKITAGASHEQRRDNFISAETRAFATNDLFALGLGDDDEDRVDSFGSKWTLRSLFGRLNYVLNNKYIIEATVREDKSSRFIKSRRSGVFLGGLLSWRLSEENFVKNLGVFDNLKLRFSYGENGNQDDIGAFDFLRLINTGSGIIFGPSSGGNGTNGLFGNQGLNQTYAEAFAVSADRSWETVTNTNFGVDIGVLDNKLNLSFDYFIRRNKDLLVNVELPTVLGITPPTLNRGELETKGWEVSFNWKDNIGDFNYFVSGTLFNDKNKLVSLEGSGNVKRVGLNNRLEGYSIGTYFGYKFDGIIQNQAELDAYTSSVTSGLPGPIGIGDARYVDIDGNGELSALGNPANGDEGDLVELGNIRPQYSFSLDLGGDYKNFDFRMLFQGVGKRTLFRGGQFSAPILGGQWFFQGAKFFYGKTWTPENTGAQFPELSVNGAVNGYNYRPSENNKINGAYLRLKNLQIGYSLPQTVLSKIGIDKLRLFVSGENVFDIQDSIARDLNFDPEAGTSSVGYPFVRTYSLGAQINF